MRVLPLVISMLLVIPAWGAERIVEKVSWEQLQGEGRLLSGEVIPGTDEAPSFLRVVHSATGPITLPLVVFPTPKISGGEYVLQGQVRYEDVEGEGYLETWNYFGKSAKYFSRTLSPSGPMESLKGSSDWRPFSLPFSTHDAQKVPSRIELNLVLPGRGTISLQEVRLVEMKAWWSERQSGKIGGILGCLGGLFGILGGLAGILAAKGKGRGLAFGILYAMAGLGGLLLMLGLSALTLTQPYHVYYPLLLGGVLFTVLGLALIPGMKRAFEQAELRKMRAMDAG